jgi:hypothetical protein
MHVKGMLSLGAVLLAAVALVSSSGAGTGASRGTARIDLSTRAAVVHYLRAIHVNPRGVVIQRGARNYAGPNCPGKGWTCTSTAHPVVQVASAGGTNTFQCGAAHCAVVQAADAPAVTNTARCIRTTGITQSCSINQTSTGTTNNEAVVVEIATKMSGLTQSASQTAQIVQQAAGGSNTACVVQTTTLDGSTVAKRGMPVTVTMDAHQSISITQDSNTGSNKVENATGSGTTWSCPTGTPGPLNQAQTVTSDATGSAQITQNLNAAPNGANMTLDIEQNRNSAYGSGTGDSTANFTQTNTLSAVASTSSTVGPVAQTESTADGGIDATVNQFSTNGTLTIDATQLENQCERAGNLTPPPLPTPGSYADCTGRAKHQLPAGWTETQFGPMRKGSDPSFQEGNGNATFGVTQTSNQTTDTEDPAPPDQIMQTNTLDGDCTTTGNCTGHQNVTNNQGNTFNGNAGTGEVTFNTACTSTCTTTANFPSGNILVSVGDGKVQMWPSTGTGTAPLHTFDTTEGAGTLTAGLAFDSVGNLYATDFNANDVSQFNSDGTLAGSFGSGYNANPESIVFDGDDNAYVGQSDGTKNILKFSPSGTLLASYAPATEDRGTDWIDLASDGCTVYYTSESTSVKRFNVCTNTQLLDLATGLLGSAAYAVKVLPGNGALVADTDRIVRLDNSGNIVQNYGTGATRTWFSLALDPSGTAFWAGDLATGDVKKFDLTSGSVLASFNTGGPAGDRAGGLAVAP